MLSQARSWVRGRLSPASGTGCYHLNHIWRQLTLRLCENYARFPETGIVSGSDHDPCDILLDVAGGESGINYQHFAVSWDATHPTCIQDLATRSAPGHSFEAVHELQYEFIE